METSTLAESPQKCMHPCSDCVNCPDDVHHDAIIPHSASSPHMQNNHYKMCCNPADVCFSLLDTACKELSVLHSPAVSPCDWPDFNFTRWVIIFYVSLQQDLKS